MSKPNKFIQFSSIGVQMGVTIFLGAYAGNYLDEKYNTEKNWYTLSLTLLAFIIAMYSLIKQLKKLENDND